MDSITINIAGSPELKSYFSTKKPGDKCSFDATFQVSEVTKDEVKGSIDDISFDEDETNEETEVKPSAEEPAMITMKMGGKEMPMESAGAY